VGPAKHDFKRGIPSQGLEGHRSVSKHNVLKHRRPVGSIFPTTSFQSSDQHTIGALDQTIGFRMVGGRRAAENIQARAHRFDQQVNELRALVREDFLWGAESEDVLQQLGRDFHRSLGAKGECAGIAAKVLRDHEDVCVTLDLREVDHEIHGDAVEEARNLVRSRGMVRSRGGAKL